MRLPFWIVNAFVTEAPFSGNPAAVVLLEHWLADARLQAMAEQHNLSETAFLVGTGNRYHLRWFTPRVEVELCGHATLAAAQVVFERQPETRELLFATLSGTLTVTREHRGPGLCMDFPTRGLLERVDLGAEVLPGIRRAQQTAENDLYIELPDAAAVAAAEPELRHLAGLPYRGLIVAAAGEAPIDIASRFFAPACGIDEDPFTGSAHCLLAPLWAERLGKTTLRARQLSQRAGEATCTVSGDRVLLQGRASTYARGTLELPDPAPQKQL